MTSNTTRAQRRRIVPEMGGVVARWYAKLRRSDHQMQMYRTQAAQLTDGLPDGADVLEVAFGPGYLAVEMARLGRVRVTGLDISPSFVDIATANARRAGVRVDLRQGDAASLPFDAGSFDLIVCQAAFKNFTRTVDVLDEMHRVLRGGRVAVIQDLNADATGADIAAEVQRMGLRGLYAAVTRATLTALRRRASTPAQLTALAARSAFRTCEIRNDGIGLEVRLRRPDI